MENNRDVTFDVMKGIGILLMLVGHWPGLPLWAHQFIYSFHMPLFFLVAGCFSKPLEDWTRSVKKNAQRLLLPFVFTQLLLIAWMALQAYAKHDVGYVLKPALSLAWGSCDMVESSWGAVYVGPMWFLPALFWGKTVFEWLLSKTHSVWLLAICVLVSLAAIVVHAFVPSPWCLLQGFSGLMFLALGWWMKNKKVPKWVVGVALLCWPLAIIFSNMEVADLHYKILPLDVMGACGGTLCMWWLSKQIARVKWLTKPLSWCGVFSLVILCFHNFEWFSAIVYSIDAHLPITIDGNGMVVFRYLLTFVLALAAIKLPYVRSVYGVKLASLKRS